MTLDVNGQLVCGLAESYTVSENLLTYKFTLREGLVWNNDKPLTSHDFSFALKRILSHDAPSPFASEYLSIYNAQKYIDGEMSDDGLGVITPDDRTVIFVLSRPDPFFLQKLSGTSMMPCNKEFFEETKGRYGRGREYLLTNGPFFVRIWDNTKYFSLRQSATYYDSVSVVPFGVTLLIGEGNSALMLDQGDIDFARVIPSQLPLYDDNNFSSVSFNDQTYLLVFNTESKLMGNQNIRKAIAAATDHDVLKPYISQDFRVSSSLIPLGINILPLVNYRQAVGAVDTVSFNTVFAKQNLQTGLKELDLKALPEITIITAAETDHRILLGYLQREWYSDLSIFLNIENLSQAEMNKALNNKAFQVALVPLTSDYDSPLAMLSKFTSDSAQNYAGFASEEFDTLIAEAKNTGNIETIARNCLAAENLLLSEVAVLPLYDYNSYYVTGENVSDIVFKPFPGQIYFKFAYKPRKLI